MFLALIKFLLCTLRLLKLKTEEYKTIYTAKIIQNLQIKKSNFTLILGQTCIGRYKTKPGKRLEINIIFQPLQIEKKTNNFEIFGPPAILFWGGGGGGEIRSIKTN